MPCSDGAMPDPTRWSFTVFRYKHLPRPVEIADAFGDADREAEHVVGADFDLAGVDTYPHPQTQARRALHDLDRGANRPAGGIEGGQECSEAPFVGSTLGSPLEVETLRRSVPILRGRGSSPAKGGDHVDRGGPGAPTPTLCSGAATNRRQRPRQPPVRHPWLCSPLIVNPPLLP